MPAILPPVAAVLAFIDRINHGDVEGLLALMADGHCLCVLDEPPVTGKEALGRAWQGYFDAFPAYVIHPWRFAEHPGGRVAVLGSTTGSHLGLSDDEERRLPVVWTADVEEGLLMTWSILDDDLRTREALGLS